MTKKKGAKDVFPTAGNEFDTACYREHWNATDKHFDFEGAKQNDWCNNPRRFLLFGRPQIGKTGAFLHLIFLLWKEIFRPRGNGHVVTVHHDDDEI
eukprot:gene21501-21293_t